MVQVIVCLLIFAFLAFSAYTRGEYVGCLAPFLTLIAAILAFTTIVVIHFGILKISGDSKILKCILYIISAAICVWLQLKFGDKK